MNRWAIPAIAAILLTGCASEYPYPAPYGATLVVSPETIEVTTSYFSEAGNIVPIEVLVTLESEDRALNNVRVWASSPNSNYIALVPQTAINGYSDKNDSEWQTSQAENYYELTNVSMSDDPADFQPNYVELATDSHGVARLYAYFWNPYPESVPIGTMDIFFSIGVDSNNVTITVKKEETSTEE